MLRNNTKDYDNERLLSKCGNSKTPEIDNYSHK